MRVQFLGATGEVTGSMYLVTTPDHSVLLECGLVQGSRKEEQRNAAAFPFAIDELDAVILSHAHIDHSGRVPLLCRRGYTGPIYAQNATRELAAIMLPDSGFLNEKEAERENRHAERGHEEVVPLYTRREAEACLQQIEGIAYGQPTRITSDLTLTFHDAGHILGSAIVELRYQGDGGDRTLVFSGDLGYRDAPVMNRPARLRHANAVIMESTYGDRQHRRFEDTLTELGEVFETARAQKGNILIPAFTVGRTQDLLYLMSQNVDRWRLDQWQIYLDSPMGIAATQVYARYRHLYGAKLFGDGTDLRGLPNFTTTQSTEESMQINSVTSGAIIIAGSGMCSGGRIHHHLANNIARPECHVVIVGFQAHGTLGRRLVDGVDEIKLWGEKLPVRARIHTVGGLSAHADQQDLVEWYGRFEDRPPLYLVHGEEKPQQALAARLRDDLQAPVTIAERDAVVEI